MADAVYLCRHGETAWSRSGQHTGMTDLPLTEEGKRQSQGLKRLLEGHHFSAVFTSPMQRALVTCTLAGLGDVAQVDEELLEWNYGAYEGITTEEIRRTVPDWSIFTHGAPGGESVAEVGARADRVIEKLDRLEGDIALFSSGHFSRVLAARWLGLPVSCGRYFILSTATLSILAYEHGLPAIKLWNAQ